MQKLVFVFRRKPGASRAEFHDHYLTIHAPLGLKHKKALAGYTVNLVDTPASFDAVTEIWTPAIGDFMGAGANSDEAAQAIIADHLSFMGPQDSYAVEEQVLRGAPLTSPLGEVSPGTKQVAFHRRGEPLPAPHPAAFRVVDNVVQRAIVLGDQPVDAAAQPDDGIAVIRTSWFEAAADAPRPEGDVEVREYRWRLP